MLTPATEKQFRKCVKEIYDFAEMFNIKIVSIEKVYDIYARTMSDFPAVLLIKAINDILAEMKIHTMPLPGEIRERINLQWSAMKRHHSNLLSALKQAEREAAKELYEGRYQQ